MQIADCLLERCNINMHGIQPELVDRPHNFHKAISTTAMLLVYSTSNDSAGLCSYCKLLPQSLGCVLRIFAGTSFSAECISANQVVIAGLRSDRNFAPLDCSNSVDISMTVFC
jgi:hypothetical protein